MRSKKADFVVGLRRAQTSASSDFGELSRAVESSVERMQILTAELVMLPSEQSPSDARMRYIRVYQHNRSTQHLLCKVQKLGILPTQYPTKGIDLLKALDHDVEIEAGRSKRF